MVIVGLFAIFHSSRQQLDEARFVHQQSRIRHSLFYIPEFNLIACSMDFYRKIGVICGHQQERMNLQLDGMFSLSLASFLQV